MTIHTLKHILPTLEQLHFTLPDGTAVPPSVHLTELGIVSKHFIDCGGTSRKEEKASLQLWEGSDSNHRLSPQKLLGIVEQVEQQLPITALEIEVTYQTDTIGVFGLKFSAGKFVLTSKQTACLAGSVCGTTSPKRKLNLRDLRAQNCC
jgi:hypothetical protein